MDDIDITDTIREGDVEDLADVTLALLRRMSDMTASELRTMASLIRDRGGHDLSNGIDAMTDVMLSID